MNASPAPSGKDVTITISIRISLIKWPNNACYSFLFSFVESFLHFTNACASANRMQSETAAAVMAMTMFVFFSSNFSDDIMTKKNIVYLAKLIGRPPPSSPNSSSSLLLFRCCRLSALHWQGCARDPCAKKLCANKRKQYKRANLLSHYCIVLLEALSLSHTRTTINLFAKAFEENIIN